MINDFLRLLLISIDNVSFFCDKYNDELMEFYCEVCDEFICYVCLVIDYCDYLYIFIKDVFFGKKREIVKLMKDVKLKVFVFRVEVFFIEVEENKVRENDVVVS